MRRDRRGVRLEVLYITNFWNENSPRTTSVVIDQPSVHDHLRDAREQRLQVVVVGDRR
jgi:hypothetical protein